MKRESTLSFIFILLFSNGVYSYDSNNQCEKLFNSGAYDKAIEEAKKLEHKYDANFCAAKAYYRKGDLAASIAAFDESQKHPDLPVDQLFAYLYKGIAQRDIGQLKASSATFTKGLDTAALGNSKYMQMERKFLYQLGNNAMQEDNGFDAIDFYGKSLAISSNDDERAEGFAGISSAYFKSNKIDQAIEYGVKASTTYQRTGMLSQYADMQLTLASYESINANYPRAIRLLQSIESFARTNGSKYYEAKALLALADVYDASKQLLLATEVRGKGKDLAESIGADDLLR